MATAAEHLIDVDRSTGAYISGWPRIKQSILTILTTRLRTRLMRLWWGSNFLDAQDKPGNEETMMSSILSAVTAINRYEPEFRVRRVLIEEYGPDGSITITVEGIDLVEHTARRVKETL